MKVIKWNVTIKVLVLSLLIGLSPNLKAEDGKAKKDHDGVGARPSSPQITLRAEYTDLHHWIGSTLNVKDAITAIDLTSKRDLVLSDRGVADWRNFISGAKKVREFAGVCDVQNDESSGILARMMDTHFAELHKKIFQGTNTPTKASGISEREVITFTSQTEKIFEKMRELFGSSAEVKKQLDEIKKIYLDPMVRVARMIGGGEYRKAAFDETKALADNETKGIVQTAGNVLRELEKRSEEGGKLCRFASSTRPTEDPGDKEKKEKQDKKGDAEAPKEKGATAPDDRAKRDVTPGPLAEVTPKIDPPVPPVPPQPPIPPQLPTPPDLTAGGFNPDDVLGRLRADDERARKEREAEFDALKRQLELAKAQLDAERAALANQLNQQDPNAALDAAIKSARNNENENQNPFSGFPMPQAASQELPRNQAQTPEDLNNDKNEPKDERPPFNPYQFGLPPMEPIKITSGDNNERDNYYKDALLDALRKNSPTIDPLTQARINRMEWEQQMAMAKMQAEQKAVQDRNARITNANRLGDGRSTFNARRGGRKSSRSNTRGRTDSIPTALRGQLGK